MKSHLDNYSCLPIYKTIPAISNTLPQTHCIRNYIFPHFVMVMTVLWAELWFVFAPCNLAKCVGIVHILIHINRARKEGHFDCLYSVFYGSTTKDTYNNHLTQTGESMGQTQQVPEAHKQKAGSNTICGRQSQATRLEGGACTDQYRAEHTT